MQLVHFFRSDIEIFFLFPIFFFEYILKPLRQLRFIVH